MAFTRLAFTLCLVLESMIGYSSQQSSTTHPTYPTYTTTTTYSPYPIFRDCPSYCDAEGDFQYGSSCMNPPYYCCGNRTYRYCCTESGLDISDEYPEVGSSCECPNSNCYETPVWEYVLYFLAPFTFLVIIAICCWPWSYENMCKKCRRTTDNATTANRTAVAPTTESTTALPDAVGRNTSLHLDLDFNYELQPPSYETISPGPPKYEEIVDDVLFYDGPFQSTDDIIYEPPVEHGLTAAPSSECLNSDDPPSNTPGEV